MKVCKTIACWLAGAFCLAGAAGCQDKTDDLTVYMPDGAPALALAGVMAADTEEDGVEYRIVNPTKITSIVTYEKESKNADLCVLPLTAASKLLGSGERYTLLGAVTHGNLYLIAKDGESIASLQTLVGKTVGALQIKEVPGLTFKTVLNKAGVSFQEISQGDSPDPQKVNLLAMAGADQVGVLQADYYLLAEPAVTAQAAKGYAPVGDLQALYGGENGYPQAVLVAKNAVVEERAEWLAEWTESLRDTSWLTAASGEEILGVLNAHLEDKTAASSWKAAQLNQTTISRCGIRFAYAAAEKDGIADFLGELLQVVPQATATPKEGFFWTYSK